MIGITEIIPNKQYKVRNTTGNRFRKAVNGSLIKAINEKKKLIKKAENILIEEPIRRKIVLESITLEEAVTRTIDYLVDLGETTEAIDLNTVYDYADRMDMYVYDYFSRDTKLSTIDEKRIKEFLGYMFKRKRKSDDKLLSVSTVEKTYTALRWVIRYCSEIADPPLLKENYTDKIRFKTLIPKGRKKNKEKKKVTDLSELDYILDVINTKANIRLKTMLNIFMDIGCRPEECLGFKWSNVDLKTGKISYEDAVTAHISKKNNPQYSGTRVKELKSKHSYRDNYLSLYTIQCLRNLKTFKVALGLPIKENDYIFTIWTDNVILSPISLEDEYKDFRKKYKMPDVKLYEFRHSISNLLLENGISPKDAAIYLGNTARTITESYTQMREETEKKIQRIINDSSRFNQKRNFDIDVIVQVLNYENEINDNVLELLDFVVNKKVTIDEVPFVLETTKRLILEQHPILETFCNKDENTTKIKLETYKLFNKSNIEITQNPNYYLSNIKI